MFASRAHVIGSMSATAPEAAKRSNAAGMGQRGRELVRQDDGPAGRPLQVRFEAVPVQA